ncbi:uncharacterized mitochondrial protein AtMg00310-like [Rosa chinensis]|uniref:uncharacterized mitochondrial protein AtMg00310-like n=1 Tax=Rosa chinensis TaxID=74649 RepID=UPI000D094CD8|nr:uncharacterized mitochondrial protein AtMg00310-like [Rosa chinensis]
MAGKKVLVKAVLQAIPTYAMNVFKFPVGLCNELNSVVANFWWGKKGGKGVHWKKWDSLCEPKEMGGLGFQNFESFSQAMATIGNYPSYVWRSILWGRDLVVNGCINRIGNGRLTRIYDDRWIPKPPSSKSGVLKFFKMELL